MRQAAINFVNGFIIGAVIGVVIGLLLLAIGIIPFGAEQDTLNEVLLCICACGGLFGWINITSKDYPR